MIVLFATRIRLRVKIGRGLNQRRALSMSDQEAHEVFHRGFFMSFMSFMSFISFMLHESPQQQHSCLPDLSFASFIIGHESPLQQHEAIAQHESVFLLVSFVFCANAKPLSAKPSPSTRPRVKPLMFFISISPVRKISA
jgi:hypothetical protein